MLTGNNRELIGIHSRRVGQALLTIQQLSPYRPQADFQPHGQ